MPNSRSEDLYFLIKSLSKSDKRAFRLYVGSFNGEGQKLFIQLFDLLDRRDELDDVFIKSKMGGLSSANYTNLKRHLYSKILISLRLIAKEKKATFKIREYIDFVYVLYGKGLYHQALRLLAKAKQEAIKHHADFSLLTIIEIEKMIQSNHITRTPDEPINNLVNEAQETITTLENRISLSNLRIKMHKMYIQKGHVKSNEEAEEVKAFFQSNLDNISLNRIGMMEQVYLNQSQVWFYYILNDFNNCYEHALKWVQLFKENRELRERDVNLYLRGYHYLLTSAFNLKKTAIYRGCMLELEKLRADNYNKLSQNSKIVSFLYVHTARLNMHFLEGTFAEGILDSNKTLSRINKHRNQLDPHKIMVLYFKISWMYIGNNQADKAQEYLLHIIKINNMNLREDIQSYARLLHLLSIYDLDDYEMLIKKVREYKVYFKKVKELNDFHKTVMLFFDQISKAPLLQHRDYYATCLEDLNKIETNQYERRSFLYLDIMSWLEAKLTRRKISEVIQSKLS